MKCERVKAIVKYARFVFRPRLKYSECLTLAFCRFVGNCFRRTKHITHTACVYIAAQLLLPYLESDSKWLCELCYYPKKSTHVNAYFYEYYVRTQSHTNLWTAERERLRHMGRMRLIVPKRIQIYKRLTKVQESHFSLLLTHAWNYILHMCSFAWRILARKPFTSNNNIRIRCCRKLTIYCLPSFGWYNKCPTFALHIHITWKALLLIGSHHPSPLPPPPRLSFIIHPICLAIYQSGSLDTCHSLSITAMP